ncbi:facilitated trehalose transporter Tret1-like [Culicoides brevitarsis]|uniref:facilitated trehalose transporter Tret1-like n=1 Tax=Culicoides brevitarsis TaxID=469753 RepID=UPI00307C5829
MSENDEFADERTRLIPNLSSTARYDNQNESTMGEASTSGRKLPQYIAALAATGGALAAGTILGWTAPAEGQLVKDDLTDSHYDFSVSKEEFSWIGAFVTLGAAFICIPVGFLAGLFGRKMTMLGLVIPFTVGWALMLFATNVTMMYVGRFMLGVAGGAFCVTAPMYTGEIAQNEVRGTLGTFFQLMITIGILFVYAVGAGVSVFYLNLICGIIPLVFGLVFFFMPESPTFYVSKGRHDDALNALKRLRGENYNCNAELEELKREAQTVESNSTNLGQALMRIESLRSAFIAIGLMFFQQMSGINAVIFYQTRIFKASGSSIDPQLSTIIVGIIQVVATFISSIIVDKLGRRLLLLLSIVLMGICLAGLGIFFNLKDNEDAVVESLHWLPVTSLCIFIIAFSLGFGPVPWLMAGELFAPDIKGFLGAIAGTFNWLLAFVITKFFANFQEALGNGPTFYLFTAFCVLGFLFVIFFVPETKGKSFQAIQDQIKFQCIQIRDYQAAAN